MQEHQTADAERRSHLLRKAITSGHCWGLAWNLTKLTAHVGNRSAREFESTLST